MAFSWAKLADGFRLQRRFQRAVVVGGSGVSLAIATSTESASTVSLAERVGVAVGSSTEDRASAVLAERVSAAGASAGESFGAATLTERLSAAAAGAGESFSDAAVSSGTPVHLAVDGATESRSDVALSPPRIILYEVAVASEVVAVTPEPALFVRLIVHAGDSMSTETFSDAALTITNPTTDLSIASGAETVSAAVLSGAIVPVWSLGPPRPDVEPPHILFRVASHTESSSAAQATAVPRITLSVATTIASPSRAALAIVPQAADAPPPARAVPTGGSAARVPSRAPVRPSVAFAVASESEATAGVMLTVRAYTPPAPWSLEQDDADLEDVLLLVGAL